MKRLAILVSLLFISLNSHAQVALRGLYTPVYLQADTSEIILRDYLVDLEPKSIELPQGLEDISDDDERLVLIGNPLKKITTLKITTHEGVKSLVLIKSAAKQVNFTYDRDDLGKDRDVRLIGSFNNWNRESKPMKYRRGVYSRSIMLEPGRYEYKLYMEGEEVLDPEVEQKVSNGMGSFNNILIVEGDSLHAAPYTLDLEPGRILVKHQKPAGEIVALWNNQELEVICKENNPPVCIIKIPEEAKGIERSYVRIFQFIGENKGRDQLIPLHYGNVIRDSEILSRQDWHKASMYFIMVDRFANGETANDEPVQDSTIQPEANYQGGDLQGIGQKLAEGYFRDLGVNTVWVSPITQNPLDAWGYWDKGKVKSTFSGYHGYWPISNIRVDYRFGTSEVFRALIDSAHAQDYNVILDYVANHVHLQHPIYQENKDWATNLYLPDSTKNTEKWDEHRLTTWFDDHLPTLDLRRYEIVDPMVDSALFWLQNFPLDGFRHDATKHIDELYWRTLTYRIRKMRDEPVYQIGETYGSPGLINSYISTGMLDAQFDFNLYDAAVTTFAKSENALNLKAVLEAGISTYGANHLMGNISGNQDRARFISYANQDIRFDEDAKLAGWDREIGEAGPKAYKRLAMLHAFNFSVPGIPCIYYGDEIGLPGGNDPDNRRMMPFDNWNKQQSLLFNQVAELNQLRSSELPLLYGQTDCYVEGSLLIIKREYFGQVVVSVFNLSEEPVEINLPFEFKIVRTLNSVRNGQLDDQMEREGPAPLRGLSYQIFANY